MSDIVRKTDVIKTDVSEQLNSAQVELYQPNTVVAQVPVKRSAYERMKLALRIFGIGSFEFEREHDDRS